MKVSLRHSLWAALVVTICSLSAHFNTSMLFLNTADTAEVMMTLQGASLNENSTNVEGSVRTQRRDSLQIPKQPMNVVLLYADDWSYTTLGANGNTFVKTPVLDQMAKDGVLFKNNAVTTSICMVSRATLYTGQYASRHKTFTSYPEVVPMYQKWNETLYPTMYRNGYHVGFFGKYHHREPVPPHSFHETQIYQNSHYITRDGVTKHITQWNEEDGMRFLKERPTDKPFFLTISFFATHAEDGSQEQYRPMNSSMHLYENEVVPVPKTMSDEHWERMPYFFEDRNFGRGRYVKRYGTPEDYQHHMKNTYRMATEVDTACGRLLKELEAQGVMDNTLIIFTTDNGNFHGQHGLAEKWYSYEESLKVPLIILDPRLPQTKHGLVSDELTLNIDLAPTILTAAGISVPDVMQGRDMSPLYSGPNPTVAAERWRKEFLYEWYHDSATELPSNLALVRKDMKYIWWQDHDYEELFDLVKDPLEENNIVETMKNSSILMEMRRRLAELLDVVESGIPP